MTGTQPPAEARIPIVEEIRQRTAHRAQRVATQTDGFSVADTMTLLAIIDAITKTAAEWATLAPADDWGPTPSDTMIADAARQLLTIAQQAATEALGLTMCPRPLTCPDGPQPHPHTTGCDRPWPRFGTNI